MHRSSFPERLVDRFDDHPLRVRYRVNQMAVGELAPLALPDFDDLRRVAENFLIAVPGTPLILLHVLAAESVATLRMKISERSNRAVETPAEAFWNRDLSELSPVSRAVESGREARVVHSLNGVPYDAEKIERATREFDRIK